MAVESTPEICCLGQNFSCLLSPRQDRIWSERSVICSTKHATGPLEGVLRSWPQSFSRLSPRLGTLGQGFRTASQGRALWSLGFSGEVCQFTVPPGPTRRGSRGALGRPHEVALIQTRPIEKQSHPMCRMTRQSCLVTESMDGLLYTCWHAGGGRMQTQNDGLREGRELDGFVDGIMRLWGG